MSTNIVNIVAGSVRSIEVALLNDNDGPESLAGATGATLRISTKRGGTTILDRSVSAGTITINAAAGLLTATLTQGESDALVPGTYLGEVAVNLPSGWYHSEPFYVKVQPSIAPHA